MTKQEELEISGTQMFDVHEERLQQLVRRAETPVLGLLGPLLPAEAREAIRQDLRVQPSVRSFIARLDKFPALFGVWLAEHVMLGLGQDGHFSLYPHLQKAIGIEAEIAHSEREGLWWAFRRAMFKLGVQPLSRTGGNHFMADEYVRQAGVPIAFADDLAHRMLQLARQVGLPDEDDQEGLLTWQTTLLSKLSTPFSVTARKAVERDGLGYYTRAFVRVHLNGGQATDADPLELALAKAFSKEGTASLKRAAIPQLLYRDGSLGVLFPPFSAPAGYRLNCGQATSTVRVDPQGGFRPLPQGLHTELVVQREDGERVLSVRLWQDAMPNRLLIFNAEGRLRASAQLNQVEPVELQPGRYIALCRFEPTNTDVWEEISEKPFLVEVPLSIGPGEVLRLTNGPAYVSITGSNQPSLTLNGQSKGSLDGLEFLYGTLDAVVEVPVEWREEGGSNFEIRVLQGSRRASLPVQVDASGRARISLDAALNELQMGGGLWRVVFELARVGEARTIQRQSVLFWSGLEGVSYGLKFALKLPPKNLIASSCRGVKVTSTLIEPTDDHSRLVQIGFDVGAGRLVHLSWHRPGVFVEVQVSATDGSATTVSRPLGAAETVSLTSAKTVVVSASEPGTITLGSMRVFVDFSRKTSKSFPASLLASRLEPGARTLAYETLAGGTVVPLLVLSRPHVATEVKTERLANVFEVRVVVQGEPTDVAITGRELSTGKEGRAEHELMAGTWHTNDLARMQVYSAATGSAHVVHVLIDMESLRPGIWLLGFGAKIGGVWGRLQDADEGRIAVAFGVNALGAEVSGKSFIADAETLEPEEAALRLTRLNEHFRQCWSPVCWEQQSWLTPYFGALVSRLKGREADFVTEVVDMAMARAPEDGRAGFVSMQFAPALLPQAFSQPRDLYKRVHIKPHPLSISLRAMPELKGAITPAFGALLHPVVAMPFQNVAEMMKGRRPRGFGIERYRNALGQATPEGLFQLDDALFLPKDGELLGPLHLAHAWRDLERGLDSSQMMPNTRKKAAVALARKLSLQRGVFDQAAPAGLRGQSPLLKMARPGEELLDETEQLRWEQIDHIGQACAWLAWYYRLESRKPDSFRSFYGTLTTLRQQIEIPSATVTDCIAYYLQVAPAMFAFYLLLWELVQTTELDSIVQHV